MASAVHWIAHGKIQPSPEPANGKGVDERALLHREGYVKVVESETGTTIRWAMFAPNWASLFFVMEWVHGALGPFQLQYYSAGWFNERYEHAWEVADRIHHLIHKSDVQLSQTVYIRDAPENYDEIPALLKKALNTNAVDEDHSIDCVYDASSQRFHVSRVGKDSSIARVYGLSPVSYPCLTGHSYDQAVSRIYPQVIQSGEPHYDHIYAAMSSPNGEVFWIPYQRVVLPLKLGRNKRGVRVVTEVTKVDISIL
jgi:hypothetical protein